MGTRKTAASPPVESKVTAATVGAGVTGAVIVVIMNLLMGEPVDVTAVQALVAAAVTALVTFVSGWAARHTPRPPTPPPPVPPAEPPEGTPVT